MPIMKCIKLVGVVLLRARALTDCLARQQQQKEAMKQACDMIDRALAYIHQAGRG